MNEGDGKRVIQISGMLKICIAIALLCEATRGRWRHFEHLRRSFEAESQNEVGCAHLTR